MTIFNIIKKHSSKYLISSAFSAIVLLIMMKYYTMVFTPTEFGILALYLIVFEYVKALVSLNMEYGISRLYFEYRDTERNEYLNTMFWFLIGTSIVVLSISIILFKYIAVYTSLDSQSLFMVAIISGILVVFVSFFIRILINEQKSLSVMNHNIFQTITNHFFSYVLISVFNLGILGRLNGQCIGFFLNLLTLLKEFSKKKLFKLKLQFNKSMAKETFILSLPLMFLYFQNIIFLYLDRIFIKYYLGDSLVGIYTFGYILGQGLSMVYEAISKALLPKVYSDLSENYDKSIQELEEFSYKYYFGLIIITVTISSLAPAIVSLLSNDNYIQASTVMPFIMTGFMMGGFYKIPSLILGFHKIVWFYPLLAFVSFGTNALLNWWLIPIYGIVGASFASFIGVFIYSSIMQYMSNKYMSKKYSRSILVIYMLIFIVNIGVFYG